MILYGVLLLGASVVVALVLPPAFMGVIGSVFGEEPGKSAPILILLFINVHHYFLDSVMWRRENPDTRRFLFS